MEDGSRKMEIISRTDLHEARERNVRLKNRSETIMARINYSHGDHMAQLGKINGLLRVQKDLSNQILKEQKKLKILEQKHLIEKIKNEEREANA